MNSWAKTTGEPIPSDWTPGPPLAPSGDWACTCGCSASGGPSIAEGITITGKPGSITSVDNGAARWALVLHDGTPEANMRLDRFDDSGQLVDSPLTAERATGVVSFHDPVMLSRDPIEDMEAATREFVLANAGGIEEAPIDNTTYGRDNGTWVPLPASYMPEAPNNSIRYGRFNSTWQPDAIQTDAAADGAAYGRVNNAWASVLPISGGTITGSLTVNQVLTVQGSNSLVLNAPVTGGSQRAILGQAANITRWQLMLGDGTAEGANNAGANFSLSAYGVAGAYLGAWLTIARADGATVFNGSGVTIQGGLAVNGLLALASPNNLAIYGGSAGQVLTTNGSGILSWTTPSGAGGGSVTISDTAPASPSVGALWWDSVGGQLYVWYSDPNTSQWVPTTNSGGGGAASGGPFLPLAGGTLTGSLNIAAASPTLTLNKASPVSGSNIIQSQSNGLMRWQMALGTNFESGLGNSGSNFQLAAFDDTGTYLCTPLSINRSSGLATVFANPVAGLGIATKQYVDAVVIGDNRIINGDMRINQRGVASGTASPSFPADRWMYLANQASKGTWAQSSGGSALPSGFGNFLLFTSSSAYASLAADYFYFTQRIEADMISDFAWGTANAQPVTLSFWANASVAGTYSGSIRNDTNTRSYPFSFPLAATGLQKVAITIPGDTAGTWVMSGNAQGANVVFDLGTGATYRGPANAWASTNYCGVTGAVSVVGTNGAFFSLTGVKLEIGSTATPFNRQSMAKSLADCQRYYQQPAGVFISNGYNATGLAVQNQFILPITMRTQPTITFSNTAYNNASGLTASVVDPFFFRSAITVTATGFGFVQYNVNMSAEL